jgi:hypothetical protein
VRIKNGTPGDSKEDYRRTGYKIFSLSLPELSRNGIAHPVVDT